MKGYLLDTNIVSVLAPGRPPIAPAVATWLRAQSNALFLSVVSAAEIEAGIAKLRRRGASERADRLTSWLDRLLVGYADQLLPFDIAAARAAGALEDAAQATGHSPGFADVAIAATAHVRDLVVLTRNKRHFMPIRTECLDPLTDALPRR